ncbi:signal peptidase I [Acetobacteraceae bacterium]|nr:signal peptidase I [Candidatus Parcubacteria bacterium]
MKVLFNILYYTFLAAVVSIGLLLVSSLMPIPGAAEVKVVKSGSMEPSIHVGSIVLIKPASSYGVGDVITFGPDTKVQIPTTHRIVDTQGEGASQTFTTKGDANDAPDPAAIRRQDIDGKVIFTIPYVGYVLDFAKKPLGFALLVGIPALLIIFEEISKIVREVRVLLRSRRGRPGRGSQGTRLQRQYASHEIPIKPHRPRVD